METMQDPVTLRTRVNIVKVTQRIYPRPSSARLFCPSERVPMTNFLLKLHLQSFVVGLTRSLNLSPGTYTSRSFSYPRVSYSAPYLSHYSQTAGIEIIAGFYSRRPSESHLSASLASHIILSLHSFENHHHHAPSTAPSCELPRNLFLGVRLQ